jgi:hypothetical protein
MPSKTEHCVEIVDGNYVFIGRIAEVGVARKVVPALMPPAGLHKGKTFGVVIAAFAP